MAKKAKKAKPVRKTTKRAKPDQDQRQLDLRFSAVTEMLRRLTDRVERLEHGHSGDPAAHAALAPEQPPADVGEVAGEAEQQAS